MQTNRFLLIGLFVLLLSACAPSNPLPPTSSATVPPTATPTILPTIGSTPDPNGDLVWDDRSIFSANLIPAFQSILEDIPLATRYKIDLHIPNDLILPIEGHLEVRYFNEENRALNEIIFRLFANYNGGEIIIENVLADQVAVETTTEADQTTLVVPLPQPLAIGYSTVISMDFSITLPTDPGGNYGLFGFFDNVLVLDTFYPMIPGYDRYGWYREFPAPSGDLSFNKIAFYEVNVDAPAVMVMAASGSMVAQSVENDRQQVTFAAGPARDFYLAGSRDFSVQSIQVGDTVINSYWLPGFGRYQQHMLELLASGISYYSEQFGTYPYSEFDVVSSPMRALGIEYPGIVGIYKDLYLPETYPSANWSIELFDTVVIHELAHQWFYNIVGNDQQDEPWVDESVTQFAVYLYFKDEQGDAEAEGRIAEWYRRWEQVDYAEIPLGLRVRDYAREVYSLIIYGRGPLFFYQLADQLGKDTVAAGLRNFYQENSWQIGTTQSIRDNLEESCQCDLSDMFNEWVYP